jgi:hypothetical protein
VDRDDLDRWVTSGDLDELLREVDRACGREDWDGLLVLRDRARAATERGHQLWPAASFAEYRLALESPGRWAGPVAAEGGGYLAPGPLTEVVAQGHTWHELAGELPPGPVRELVRQERVLRGEDLSGEDPGADGAGDGLPGRLAAWEPAYELAEYRSDGARFPAPPSPVPREAVVGRTRESAPDAADGAVALEEAVRHWASHSDGRVRSVGVEGTAGDAITSLDAGRAALVRVSVADAAGLLAWAAASGGARGRRRGMATGRFEAWWALAALSACGDDWPTDPGPAAEELRWYVWTPEEPPVGWTCRIAVEDPDDGLAWALDATDRA